MFEKKWKKLAQNRKKGNNYIQFWMYRKKKKKKMIC